MTDASALLPDEPEEIEGGFSRRALGWIIGTVAVSFISAVLLGVYGKDLEKRPNPGTNTFSRSALGHRALVELLQALDLGVLSRQSRSARGAGPRRPLIVAEPDLSEALGRLAALRREAKDRGATLIVVLPKWHAGAPRKDKPEWLSSVDLLPPARVLAAAQAIGEPALNGLALRRAPGKMRCKPTWSTSDISIDLEPAQLLAPSNGVAGALQCPGGVLVAWLPATASGPQTVLVSDPDLLNNYGLGRAQNAVVLVGLLTNSLGATGVVFDETVHGFNRTPGLLAEALRFPMSLAVLQSLILLGVVLWAGMGRFGKPLPAPAGLAAGKEVLIDNAAKLLASGGHAADTVNRYFRQTTRAVAAHFFLPPDLPDGERLARLQRLTDVRARKLSLAEVEQSIRRLPEGRRGGEPAQRIARRLHQWRVEMTNGNRESP